MLDEAKTVAISFEEESSPFSTLQLGSHARARRA